MKILIIEDEKDLLNSITAYLKHENFVCESVSNYEDAVEKIFLYNFDVIVVDITLPDGSGIDIIREVKKMKSRAGIIIISARNALGDKVSGLETGADDYLTKPFHLSELNARIKSIIRRRNFDGNNEIALDNMKINPGEFSASIGGQDLSLTKKEFDLLLFFLTNKNHVISKESIAEHLWGDNIDMVDSYDFLYSHVKNLRKKIIEKGGKDYIKTVYGIGYKFEVH